MQMKDPDLWIANDAGTFAQKRGRGGSSDKTIKSGDPDDPDNPDN